jgi:uncharacterized membrane protein
MMQNRANRNLLFGGRGTGGVGDVVTESLEADNQRGVERLGGSAGAMKDIALAIEADVADQNNMLDGVDRRLDHTNNVVITTFAALSELVNDRTGAKMSTLVGGMFVVLVVAYLVLRR